MNNKIKFLEIAKKQSAVMPKDNIDIRFNNADQNITQVHPPFSSSFSQKVDLNRPFGDASTSNAHDNVRRNVPYHPKNDLQRRHVQLEGYRQICFDGIPSFPNPIPQEMRKRLPKFVGNNAITCEDHLRSFLDMMSDYEVEAKDVMMKFFVQSLIEDAREWFKRLLESSIWDWKDIEYYFKEQYGDKQNQSYILSEFNNIKRLPNESVIEFNNRFQKRMYKLMQVM